MEARFKRGVIGCLRCRKRRAMIDKMCIECQNFLCDECYGDTRYVVCSMCRNKLEVERKRPKVLPLSQLTKDIIKQW